MFVGNTLLASEVFNSNGGIKFVEQDENGNPVEVYKMIELVAEDDEGNPEKSVNAYKKLVTKDKVDTIVGSLTSGCTAAITALAQAQKVLMVAPAATMTSITDAGDYVFRACFIDPFQGTVGGKFAAENLGKTKAAILYDISNDYSVGLSTNFKIAFEQAGGTVVAEESYTKGDMDFNAQLTKIKNAKPDVVYLPDYYATVALIAKQLRARDIGGIIVIDYIDMDTKEDEQIIQKLLEDNLKKDRAKTQVIGFTKLHLLEMTRKHVCSE